MKLPWYMKQVGKESFTFSRVWSFYTRARILLGVFLLKQAARVLGDFVEIKLSVDEESGK